jgi:hypothetical protein
MSREVKDSLREEIETLHAVTKAQLKKAGSEARPVRKETARSGVQ